ncbi:MAG: redoxin domain-containing protein [Dehalococcoidales bacterium]|nr:redoxin domain-containing protein [Dehalococcoidales bacterium]
MARVIKVVVALFLLMVVLAAAGCSGGSDGGQAPALGRVAPDFQLQKPDGQTISLVELRGRPVIINFWATWCGPCRMEMPALQEVYEDREWAERGLIILAVNLGESASAVRKFMEANRLSFTVLLDTEQEVGMMYNISAIPTTYFVDNDGIIRHIKMGAFRERSEIDRSLLNMLMKVES